MNPKGKKRGYVICMKYVIRLEDMIL